MKKGFLALGAAVFALGPAGVAHAYEAAADANETGTVCIDFASGESVDDHAVWEDQGTGYPELVSISCPENFEFVPAGYCEPDYDWGEGQDPDPRCAELDD